MNDNVPGLISTHRQGKVGYVLLNRPEAVNAFNLNLATQFIRAVQEFNEDSSTRVIVVRGTGKVFSAGGDVREMLGYVKDGTDRAAYFRAPLTAFDDMVMALRQSPKPVLAAVHGAVAGVAFNTMLACDMVIAEEKTRFTQAFIRIGLNPDGGGTWMLPRLVGYQRACQLTFLPHQIDAQTALAWGLINWIVPQEEFEAKLDEITSQLADSPAEALRRTKELLNSAYDYTLPDHMERERLCQIDNAAHFDFEEGLTAFVEKRPPKFLQEE
jgi:2-(1,2-epoxy-1,2-dihydrophenyl)acetyl-CoA isomerase